MVWTPDLRPVGPWFKSPWIPYKFFVNFFCSNFITVFNLHAPRKIFFAFPQGMQRIVLFGKILTNFLLYLSWPSLIKHISADLEDSLAEVEKICCGLVSSERSEVLTKPNRFFQPQLSYPLSQNLYP